MKKVGVGFSLLFCLDNITLKLTDKYIMKIFLRYISQHMNILLSLAGSIYVKGQVK